MISEAERQRWMDIFWKSAREPVREARPAGEIVSREAWLAEFWRAHDQRVSELAQTQAGAPAYADPDSAERNLAESARSAGYAYRRQQATALPQEQQQLRHHRSGSAE